MPPRGVVQTDSVTTTELKLIVNPVDAVKRLRHRHSTSGIQRQSVWSIAAAEGDTGELYCGAKATSSP